MGLALAARRPSAGRRLQDLVGMASEVRIWDLPARRERARLPGLQGYIAGMDFTPDGTRLAITTINFDPQASEQPGEG